MLATVAFEFFVLDNLGAIQLLTFWELTALVGWDAVLASELAISGKINSVLDGFLELGNFAVVLHFVPLGCRSHKHLIQNENWQDRREHCAHSSVGFTREGEVHLGQDCNCSPGARREAS